MSMHLVQASAEPLKALEQIHDRACDDLAIAYGLTPDEIMGAGKVRMDQIIAGLEAESTRLGRENISRLLKSESTRVNLRSDKLRLSGTVDRIVAADGQLLPAIVSASQPPENGIFSSDRIRLAAYALLMSERFGREVKSGLVEYMGGWNIRLAELHPGNKREALSLRRRIEEMESAMPDTRRGKWCDKCSYNDRCTVRVSFMDSLFGIKSGK